MDPLKKIPNRETLPQGPSLRQLAKEYAPEPLKETYRLADLIGKSTANFAFGEDSGLPMAESLIPGAELVSKISQGKRPGALDVMDVIPGVGSLKTLGAMGPIVGTLSELKQGGRLGKIARNLDKAKNPYIERWHRTRSKNDRSIKAKGLLVGKDNPNYGKNTGDESGLPMPAAWLGTSPTEIPVLQYYAMNKPHELSTYRVRIPKDEYFNTPRMKWDSGSRGSSRDARVVRKGESSLTGEVGRRTGNESLIDLYGKTIPPEYLEKIPNREIKKMKEHADEMMNFKHWHPESSRDQTLSEIGSDIVKNEMLNWMPMWERQLFYGYQPPTLKSIETGRPDDLLKWANEQAMKDNRGIPKYGFQRLHDTLPKKFSTKDRYYGRPDLKGLTNPENVATGHISRGWQSPVATDEDLANWNPKWRAFDWNYFENRLDDGTSPFYAALGARPKIKLVDTPEGLKPEVIDGISMSYGKVSRGFEPGGGTVSRLSELANEISKVGLRLENPRQLADILIDNPSMGSAALESIAKSNPSSRFSGLKGATNSAQFNFSQGAIGRGQETEPISLQKYYREKMEEYMDGSEWQYDDTPAGMEEMIEDAEKYAGNELRELMKENLTDGDDVSVLSRYANTVSPME